MILKTVSDSRLMWTVYETGMTDLFLTTTNSTITKTGRLVMGKGHARQVKQRIGRNVDQKLAQAIEEAVMIRVLDKDDTWDIPYIEIGGYRVYGDYYLLVSRNWPKVKLGAFQTKRYFKDSGDKVDSKLSAYSYTVQNMVYWSTLKLKEWCIENPEARVDMPFPGIGAGGCTFDEIYPIIEDLPDTVYVWRLSE